MKRWMILILVLAMVTLYSFGCSTVHKDTQVKCPKCGAIFTPAEGDKDNQKPDK